MSQQHGGNREHAREQKDGSRRDEDGWRVYDKRYWPGDRPGDHLTFAMRHEDLDLLVLRRIFAALSKDEIETVISDAPTGVPARRLWFLYEMLTGERLDIPDTPNVAAAPLLDPKAYFTGKPKLSRRHRVRDNLLGTRAFCPCNGGCRAPLCLCAANGRARPPA